ncbi:hypothetical protein THARTR1_02728 [Trichoderma harzianum]|uniref:Uncharacterized protein n=1 Tax=Trichoderma harzianum TaxID=5544 RepID=A0A2K0UHL6_TRIHA|nr:hypothetical protein THARTR1_02728 [Trichoderma harzianum]
MDIPDPTPHPFISQKPSLPSQQEPFAHSQDGIETWKRSQDTAGGLRSTPSTTFAIITIITTETATITVAVTIAVTTTAVAVMVAGTTGAATRPARRSRISTATILASSSSSPNIFPLYTISDASHNPCSERSSRSSYGPPYYRPSASSLFSHEAPPQSASS